MNYQNCAHLMCVCVCVCVCDTVVEKNQFNYFSKGCQTFTRPMKDLYVSTVQPLTANFQATVGSWEIYDTYVTV